MTLQAPRLAPVVSLGIRKGGDAKGNANVGLHRELQERDLPRAKQVILQAPRLIRPRPSVGRGEDALGNVTVTPMVERKQDLPTG